MTNDDNQVLYSFETVSIFNCHKYGHVSQYCIANHIHKQTHEQINIESHQKWDNHDNNLLVIQIEVVAAVWLEETADPLELDASETRVTTIESGIN